MHQHDSKCCSGFALCAGCAWCIIVFCLLWITCKNKYWIEMIRNGEKWILVSHWIHTGFSPVFPFTQDPKRSKKWRRGSWCSRRLMPGGLPFAAGAKNLCHKRLCMYVCIYIYIDEPNHMYIYLSIYLSIHPSIHPSIYLSIYLSI